MGKACHIARNMRVYDLLESGICNAGKHPVSERRIPNKTAVAAENSPASNVLPSQ
jgi:hypothetical protein